MSKAHTAIKNTEMTKVKTVFQFKRENYWPYICTKSLYWLKKKSKIVRTIDFKRTFYTFELSFVTH